MLCLFELNSVCCGCLCNCEKIRSKGQRSRSQKRFPVEAYLSTI